MSSLQPYRKGEEMSLWIYLIPVIIGIVGFLMMTFAIASTGSSQEITMMWCERCKKETEHVFIGTQDFRKHKSHMYDCVVCGSTHSIQEDK